MALTAFKLDIVRRSLLEEGFFDLNDLTVSDRVLEIERRGFLYRTEYSIDFYKQFTFNEVSGIRHFYNCRLTIFSESDLSSKPPLNGVASDTG